MEDIALNSRFKELITKLKDLKEKQANTRDSFGGVMEFLGDLPKFKAQHLVEAVEFCEELIRDQDSSFIAWKDILPPVVGAINKLPQISVNGIPMPGGEYRQKIIISLTTLKWQTEIVIPLAEMFREMVITKEERERVMKKLCESLPSITPSEVPSLAYQLFSLSRNPTLLIMPILSLQKYFNTFYYKKLYNDLESNTTDFDSIEMHSDKEMRNFEETVLYHLNNITEFSMTEKEIVASFRALSATPSYILTPFVATALLTVSKINRQIEMNRLSLSVVLPFLRSVIKNAEKEKQMASESAWCRSTFNRDFVNIERLFGILFEQSHLGMDVVTPGFVGLLFSLLKSKNQPDLNTMAINLLQQFLKKRQHFGRGIVKHLLEFLLANYEAPQLAECMNSLSLTSTLAVSECFDGLKNVMDFLLMIPGLHAMRIVTFIFPLIKISFATRDYLIDILRNATFSNEEGTRTFGIYGFCTLLKHLKNSNSRRVASTGTGLMTQISISGYSMMSQATLGNQGNPNRDFDMLTMEILGILRKVFDEGVQMKEILYDTLLRAVDRNVQLAPHVLFFIDFHFRNYLEVDELNFNIKFSDFIMERDGKIEVWDNLGALIYFVGFSVVTSDKYELQYDTKILRNLLELLVNRIGNVTFESLGITGPPTPLNIALATHFVYCLEGVMAYCALASTPTNKYLEKVSQIFEHYEKCTKTLKDMWETLKKATGKKGKKLNLTKTTMATQMTQVPQLAVGKSTTNIWDFATLERFLIVIYEKANIYASTQHLTSIRENREFHCHVLRNIRDFIRDFPSQPEYKHVTHSRRLFMLLCSCSKILFEHCVKKLIPIMERFDVEAAMLGVESFKQCLITADSVYKRKLSEFLRFVTNQNQSIPENVTILVKIVEELLLKCLEETSLFDIDANSRQIPGILLSCLEMLYSHIPADRPEASSAFEWLHNFCQKHSIVGKGLDSVHKMLFQQYLKTDEGFFLSSVASQLSNVMGTFGVDLDNPTPSTLTTIQEENAESCFMSLVQVLKKEISDVDYLILKVKSILTKLKIMGTTNSDEHTEPLVAMEKAVCMHLIKVANCILIFSNIQIKLGAPVEAVLRLIISYYVAVTNFTKHLTVRHPLIPVNYSVTRFEKLVQITGSSLSKASYSLITFIYDLLAPETQESSSKDAKKKESVAIVVRNTRYLSTMIREMENFNKFVRMLGRKTKNRVLEKFLHEDCVRDFRIKKDQLRGAIEDEIDEDYSSPEDSEVIDGSSSDEDHVAASVEINPSGSSGASTVQDVIPETDHEDAMRRNVRKVRNKSKKPSDTEEESPSRAPKKTKAKPAVRLNKRAAEIVVKKSTRKPSEDEENPPKRARKSK